MALSHVKARKKQTQKRWFSEIVQRQTVATETVKSRMSVLLDSQVTHARTTVTQVSLEKTLWKFIDLAGIQNQVCHVTTDLLVLFPKNVVVRIYFASNSSLSGPGSTQDS